MTEHKRLYRSKKQRMIAGVCGGIAEYFNIDPVIPRLIAVLVLVGSAGSGLLAYIILWVVVPEAPAAKPKVKKVATASTKSKGSTAKAKSTKA